MKNISSEYLPIFDIGNLFTIIGQPTRLQILIAIGREEVCVCHLEVVLQMRQAVISQHLIHLKKHKLVASRKNARYQYYRLVRPELLEVISAAAIYLKIPEQRIFELSKKPVAGCSCPLCVIEDVANKTCK